MAHNQVYMPIFESFNTTTSEGHEDSAEDSDGTAAAATLAGTSAGITPQQRRTSNKATLDDTDDKRKRASGKGKRKIAIEYIKDKKSRAVTFSKRKAGIFAKARELSTLTGSNVLLLVVSESGVVYTYTTEKFQPMVTHDVGKNMIAACLSGKVNFDDRFSSYPGAAARAKSSASEVPKRGGDILLKDAFTTTTTSQSPSTLYNAPDRTAGASFSSSKVVSQDTSQHDYSEAHLPMPPIYNEPPLSFSENDSHPLRESAFSHLVKVPRITEKRQRESDDIGNDPSISDDLSEGECEAQMRKLRRSLSIERRFEKAGEEEKPRLVRNGDETNFVEHEMNDQYNNKNNPFDADARRREGWSFTAAEDAWSRFKERFRGPTSNTSRDSDTAGGGSSNDHGQSASAIALDYGISSRETSLQDETGARPRNGNSRRAAQVVILPEL